MECSANGTVLWHLRTSYKIGQTESSSGVNRCPNRRHSSFYPLQHLQGGIIIKTFISGNSRLILDRISDGQSYDAILEEFPYLTFFDIADAASEALNLTDESPDFPTAHRRVLELIAQGYGYDAIRDKEDIEAFDIQKAAFDTLELVRRLKRPKVKGSRGSKRSHRRSGRGKGIWKQRRNARSG